MWPKPSRKKGKSQGTKARLKALKEDLSEGSESEDSEFKSKKTERRKPRPPNRNRKKKGDLEKRREVKKTKIDSKKYEPEKVEDEVKEQAKEEKPLETPESPKEKPVAKPKGKRRGRPTRAPDKTLLEISASSAVEAIQAAAEAARAGSEESAKPASEEVERAAQEEAERVAQEEAERAAKEEAERAAQEEAERAAQEEAERAAQEEAERAAKEEAERAAQEEAERAAKEEAERAVQEEAERAAQEEAARAAQEELARTAQEVPPEVDDAAEEGEAWKQSILEAYKGNPKDSNSLLENIPDKKAHFEAGERQKQELIEEAMMNVVDKMFDNFQNTAYGFNQVTQGSDLELVWIRPSVIHESTGQWSTGEARGQKVFTGRISTRYWTLVTRGTQEAIMAYILPSDKLLSFGTSAFDFDPFAAILPESDGTTIKWTIQGREIPQDIFPNVFRALLDGLIRFANEEAEPSETFRLEDIGFVTERKEATPEAADQGFARDDEPELLSPEEQAFDPREVNMQMQNPASEPTEEIKIADPKTNVKSGRAPVEQAIEQAFEAAQYKAQEEYAQKRATQEDMVDPGASFIEGISSQVASQATEEIDMMRGNIQQGAPQEVPQGAPPLAPQNTVESSENTGQWKMIGGDLPPSVASQWQNFVQKTTDELPKPDISAQDTGVQNDSGEWKTVEASIPGTGTDTDQGFPQAPSADMNGWVHPSQQAGASEATGGYPQSQEPSGGFHHVVSTPNPAMQFEDDETAEFTTSTGHSHYLLTEEDVDDRAIQTAPPDPTVYKDRPDAAAQQSMANQAEQYLETEEEIEEQIIEQEIEYIEEEVEEELQEEFPVEPTIDLPRVSAEAGSKDLVHALRDVVTTIDLKVERLSQKGAEAFANKDFKRAEVIIKLSERLNDFKDEASKLLSILGSDES